MNQLLVLLMVGVGALTPIQAGVNAELRRHAGHALWAGTTNFVVGLAVLLLMMPAMKPAVPAAAKLGLAPWWAFCGGLIGASLVVSSLVAAPRLGAATVFAALLCGQLSCSIVLDHFGWVGYPLRAFTPGRALGVLMLASGVWLMHRG